MPFFGTVVTLKVCFEPDQSTAMESAFGQVWQRFGEINARLNTYDPASDLSRLNAAAGQAVRVNQEVADLLQASERFSLATQGTFNVAVGPLLDLWRDCSRDNRVPSREEILAAKSLIESSVWSFRDDGAVALAPGASVTLNAIVPGYAADAGAQILKQAGFKNFFVDAGGEIYASGHNCQSRPWHIGVRDPGGSSGVLEVVEARDVAVSTSGDYEKFFEIKGQRYSHIINPLTGYPVTGAVSTTVIAPTALEADVWSTALSVLGPRMGVPLINSLGDGYGALFLVKSPAGKIERYSTSGYDHRLLEKDRNF
jgi:thiamine biosynthesis lipoprotein